MIATPLARERACAAGPLPECRHVDIVRRQRVAVIAMRLRRAWQSLLTRSCFALSTPLSATPFAATERASKPCRVLWRELVSVLAMRLLGVLCGSVVAAQDVLAWRDRLEVVWVYAARSATQVVKMPPFRYLAVAFFPCEAVGRNRNARSRRRPLDARQHELTVLAPVALMGPGCPDPARSSVPSSNGWNRPVHVHLFPESRTWFPGGPTDMAHAADYISLGVA